MRKIGVRGMSASSLAALSRCFALGSRLPCGSVAALCVCCAAVLAFLSGRFALGSRLLFDAYRQTEQLAMCCISIPRESGSPVSAFSCRFGVIGLCGFTWGLCVFGQAIPTGLRPEPLRGRLYEKERRDRVAFLLI